MIVSLTELKDYLRIDSSDDDSLLTDLLASAEKTCADILRMETSELEDTSNVKIAILYCATYLYEHREQADHNKMDLTLRALLFGDRSEEF